MSSLPNLKKGAIKHLPSLTKYVVFSIAFVILYTIVNIVLACNGIAISDELTRCVYGFFAGEVVTCGLMMIFKIRENSKQDIAFYEFNNGDNKEATDGDVG